MLNVERLRSGVNSGPYGQEVLLENEQRTHID